MSGRKYQILWGRLGNSISWDVWVQLEPTLSTHCSYRRVGSVVEEDGDVLLRVCAMVVYEPWKLRNGLQNPLTGRRDS